MDIALLEILLFYGVVFGLAIWQLISVRREIREDRRQREQSLPAANEQSSGVAPSGLRDAPSAEPNVTGSTSASDQKAG
jgi:cytoskeletal protein RodZ